VTGIAVALRQEFMEAKVEKLAGPRYQDVREQKQSRCGQEKGYLVIGPRKLASPVRGSLLRTGKRDSPGEGPF